MARSNYTTAFREQALQKVYQRGGRPIRMIAEELNVTYHTLKYWMKMDEKRSAEPGLVEEKSPRSWSAEERLQALAESHGLAEEALNAWCRQKGIYAYQLAQWREEFCRPGGPVSQDKTVRQLKEENQKLTRELARKEKALAEAGALLILQKKFQALWEDGEK